MATWNSRGLRGSTLEEMINYTNDCYRKSRLGLIQKIPTPITPIEMDKASRHITLAYFEQKSTVDYIGVVQGIPVCFDAKECHASTFPLQNIHEHQMRFMKEFEEQSGIAFVLLYFTAFDELYYVPYRDLARFWERSLEGGRKSFRYEEVDKSFLVRVTGGAYVHYLEALERDLQEREKKPDKTDGAERK